MANSQRLLLRVLLGFLSDCEVGILDSYRSVRSQVDMDHLLTSIAGFHDSMTKEIHLVNRGYVAPDKSMAMSHRFDAQVLIQSQWEPLALELLFIGIAELSLNDPGEYWGASGIVKATDSPVEKTEITMTFDSALKIVCNQLLYRTRREWLGKQSFLKSEVPMPEAVSAHSLQDNWRQCSSCSDAWEEPLHEEFSYCPGCGFLTRLGDVLNDALPKNPTQSDLPAATKSSPKSWDK
jgi:hypothetical protein